MDKSLINEKQRGILVVADSFGGPQPLSFEHSRTVRPLDSVTNANKTAEDESVARRFDLSLAVEDLQI